ncbi:hypothetical protein N3K63_14200 [Microbacterium sp. W1N]|uniref:hypothetical protein n=1 Tax=Microbacterium festucae TaxID=2977531 RepID=UPI0021C24CD5|nr:hypothetical protein [Microbacterium festucae]MCT9821433.1 hypothetical protein [Microbacterium festucae]
MPTRPEPAAGDGAQEHSRRRRTIAGWSLGLVGGAVLVGGVVIYGWMIDETHFDRPSARFDELAARVEAAPGVSEVSTERWVEAPTFAQPTSWLSATVDAAALPAVLDEVCAGDHPDPVTMSLRVRTAAGTTVSLHGEAAAAPRAADAVCPAFGFDAAPLVSALDEVVPGLEVQPAVWDAGRFAIVATADPAAPLSALLPLVAHADDLARAAGRDPGEPIEINAATLGLTVAAGERGRTQALLRELADERGVVAFWADDGSGRSDGAPQVQVTAPAAQHAAITRAIRASGLAFADYEISAAEG